MLESDLIPCPFCGGTELKADFFYKQGWSAHVKCLTCSSYGPAADHRSDSAGHGAEELQEAMRRWNARI